MGLTNEHVGPKILAKIKIYVLTRAELLITLCYEIPCNFQGGRRVSVKFLNAEIVLRSTQTEKQYYFAMQDCQFLFRSCLNVRTSDAQ